MESRHILIVESKNDRYFVDSLIRHINNIDVESDTPVCAIDDYVFLDGLSLKKLENEFHELRIKIEKQGLEKVGILLDADEEGIDKKIQLINNALEATGYNVHIEEMNKWKKCDVLDVLISCHILNVAGRGELETILKIIKKKDSLHADCLKSWKDCLESNGKSISKKDYDKFWVNIYQRFDCCSPKERKQADRKCSNQASLEKDIWDFSHDSLSSIKSFLQMFIA